MLIIATPMLLLEAILSIVLVIYGNRPLGLEALLEAELTAMVIRGAAFCGLFTLLFYFLFESSTAIWEPLQDDDHIPLRPKAEEQVAST